MSGITVFLATRLVMARLVDQTPSSDGDGIQAVSRRMLNQPPDTLTNVDRSPIQEE